MGFFSAKVTCAVCGKETGLNRYQLVNKEWICRECFKACGYTWATPIRLVTSEQAKIQVGIQAEQQDVSTALIPTTNFCKKCGNKIEKGSVFCSKCGINLNVNTNNEQKVVDQKENDIKVKNSTKTLEDNKKFSSPQYDSKAPNKKAKKLTKKQKIVISIVAIIFIIIAIPLSHIIPNDNDVNSDENDYINNSIDENQEIITYLNDKWTDGNIEITLIDVKIDKWLYSQYSDLQEGYNDNRKMVCFKIKVKNLTNEKISFGVHSCDYKLTYTSGDDNNALSLFECTDAWGKRIGEWMPIRTEGDQNYYDNLIGVSIDSALIYDSHIEANETRIFMNAFVTEEKSLEDAMHSINISKVRKRGWVFTYYDHLGKIILQN